VHGQAVKRGVMDAPVFTSCHREHAILSPSSVSSSVHPSHIRETCGQCHGNVRLSSRFGLPSDRLVTFDASFHGLEAKAGSETVANCASCHGVHNILPSSDPRSTVNPQNLPATCGKCHHGAGSRFGLGQIHQLAGGVEPKSVRWVRQFYLVAIPLLIGLMLLHNLGDWARKLAERRFRWVPLDEGSLDPLSEAAPRMYGFERVVHGLLIVSFVVLAWTGFALRYPDGWWARPLLVWESAWPVRGTIHRVASVVFMVVGALHVISLIHSKRLRYHWQALWPVQQDAIEALRNFRYNLGFGSARPLLSAHSYIEKIEYWAVLWGAVIMGATGVMLWGHNVVLAWLPKSVLDFATAVHFYEATLAVLAILVWHFYSVIFDPDVYPMDASWLTGRTVRRRKANLPPSPPPPLPPQSRGEGPPTSRGG
jgi:cytochrome b subunit of formate dehydrogenase